ncbi:MAG: hypothetical protein BWY82_00960 [Verrucomicrobia bacterium ADurb.Bin474]|nr:MAG: hypothetical protein BWY82_00960 [Verrucomicrobia bacterium ADurb.Bin474]
MIRSVILSENIGAKEGGGKQHRPQRHRVGKHRELNGLEHVKIGCHNCDANVRSDTHRSEYPEHQQQGSESENQQCGFDHFGGKRMHPFEERLDHGNIKKR